MIFLGNELVLKLLIIFQFLKYAGHVVESWAAYKCVIAHGALIVRRRHRVRIPFFRKEIANFINNKDLFFKICLSSFPVMIFGYILVKTGLVYKLRNIEVIAWTTIIFGILLYISDKFKLKNIYDINSSYKSTNIFCYSLTSLIHTCDYEVISCAHVHTMRKGISNNIFQRECLIFLHSPQLRVIFYICICLFLYTVFP